jgi:hypothetical protein
MAFHGLLFTRQMLDKPILLSARFGALLSKNGAERAGEKLASGVYADRSDRLNSHRWIWKLPRVAKTSSASVQGGVR